MAATKKWPPQGWRDAIIALLLALLILSLYYSGQFSQRTEAIRSCKRVNITRIQVNRVARRFGDAPVPIADCGHDFAKPWPF